MKVVSQLWRIGQVAFVFFVLVVHGWSESFTNSVQWDHKTGRVSADVRDWNLYRVLEQVARQSGWHVYVEPNLGFTVSVKFKDQSPGEALKRMLRDLNFAMVAQTNAPDRLYVFRTSRTRATQQVGEASPHSRRVPLELLVILKSGVDIGPLARAVNAKVIGYIPEINAYRLLFDDEESLERARALLANNLDVVSVGDNYYVDVPPGPRVGPGLSAPNSELQLHPPKSDACTIVVGLVDTAVQPLDAQLEKFIKQRIALNGSATTESSAPTHGTAMTHALLQSLRAVEKTSTSVQIVAVDVFGSSGAANSFSVAAGMIKAANSGATVINASLGGYEDVPVLRSAVKQLYDHGIPVFAAVGNDASSAPFFPAAYPEVVSVTAVDGGAVAGYANVGISPDAAAPGAVLFPFDGQVFISQGTSVSSAAATGVAAGLADSSCAPWAQVISAVQKNLPLPAGN